MAIGEALAVAKTRNAERDPLFVSDLGGFYLDFEFPAASAHAAELLENRPKQIELVAFRQDTKTAPAIATIFIPNAAADHFSKKVEAYRSRDVEPRKGKDGSAAPEDDPRRGRPKYEELVARIERVSLASVRSVYTDDAAAIPADDDEIWWEVWIRRGRTQSFDAVARHLNLRTRGSLVFPDRVVRLVYASGVTIGRLFLDSDAVAELRIARDTPTLFLDKSNVEQVAWAADLSARTVLPEEWKMAVCLLDTGTTQAHPLLRRALDPGDVHVYDPTWNGGDSHGHGTNMAGTALYGDLLPLLTGSGPISLTHCLESVKMLPDQGENEPRLYGAITGESISRAEVAAPERRRAVCMAITSAIGTNRGRPSSWSSAVDQLCFGDETVRRLIFISAGNIGHGITGAGYPWRNETEPIENPAQAWNAISVGAHTDKTTIVDPSFAGWKSLAPVGDLCPQSRTSVMWESKWPIKPEVVMEGGNWAVLGDQCDCPDDLGILTTHRDPTLRQFAVFGDTSAATALAGNLAGRIWAAMPDRWPETIRAMVIHSAEWTPVMRRQFQTATSEQQKRFLMRKYGYGVPSYERAVLSAANDLTLIAEDELDPLRKDGSPITTGDMNLHDFPWPRTELEELGEMVVELRVTLSYFVEPNPGERGWLRRHRYPSHALRFAVKRSLESVESFRKRINAAAISEEEGYAPTNAGSDHWLLGRIRDVGSIHSDYWLCTAAELAQQSAIAVYPVGGWWKEKREHARYDRRIRYSLVVSIRAVNGTVDIYTPVRVQVAAVVEVAT